MDLAELRRRVNDMHARTKTLHGADRLNVHEEL